MNMNVGILSKVDRSQNSSLKDFIDRLQFNKINCFFLDEENRIPDIIVVFGGDGTILLAVNYAIKFGVPIVSVNAGTVGFLTDFEPSDVIKVADLIAENKLKFFKRSLVSLKYGEKTYHALNDVVIESDRSTISSSVVSRLSLFIENMHVYDLSSDGVIVATPTGSTAYSLSAGGVILSPDIGCFILTPICSHSLTTRPIVYSDKKKVRIKLRNNSSDCILSMDGRVIGRLKPDDEVEISKSDEVIMTVVNGQNFFNKIYLKLGK